MATVQDMVTLTRGDIVTFVKGVCEDSIVNSPLCGRNIQVFDDTYSVKGGRRRRLKLSGLYATQEQRQKLTEFFNGLVISNKWKFNRVYNRTNSMLYNYNWTNDSGVLCITFDLIK